MSLSIADLSVYGRILCSTNELFRQFSVVLRVAAPFWEPLLCRVKVPTQNLTGMT